ncbi:Pentatricopeptide repeat-containing protein [Melia azedarach]|uniref:Pentatricopeptide repeat-containing protein n=1 Tax=Melia azedarach TaxID=155640 RepID=A0ACC1WUQ5_MELAZ|nr:Pentatricopeptide repeat-containing protein [Melia azedarach]
MQKWCKIPLFTNTAMAIKRSSSSMRNPSKCGFPIISLSISSLPSYKDMETEPQQNNSKSHQPISDQIFNSAPKLGSYKLGDSTFYSLIENYANSGDFRSLEKILYRMRCEKRVVLEKSFISIFKAYGKAHLVKEVMSLFDKMVEDFHCKRTVKSFNSVLNVIVQEGLYHQALEFYNRVVNAKHMNILPNTLSFNLIIKTMCRLGLVDNAMEVFREMPMMKCTPDIYTYCTLMDGLCKENRIDEAVLLLDEMQTEGCFPTPVTFNVLINGLCKKGDLVRAAKLVDNMFLKGCVPNEVTYNTLIHGLCLKGELDKAVGLLDRMVANKCVPNEVTYGTIINGLVKQGRAVDGVRVLISMEERRFHVNEYIYSSLISGLFKEEKPEDAMKLWKQMMEKGCKPNGVVYSALIDGFCRVGKPDEAEEILSEMITNWLHTKCFYLQLLDESVLIHGLCEDGKLREAMMVWTQMLSRGCKPDVVAYSSMILGLCNAGSLEEAFKLFNEMLWQEPEAQPDVFTYNILFNALCKQNNISHAIDLLNSMMDRGCDPDLVTCNIFLTALKEKLDTPQDGREFLNELAGRLFKRQRTIGALKIVEVMLQKFLSPETAIWERVVKEVCKPKRIQAAINKCWSNLYD